MPSGEIQRVATDRALPAPDTIAAIATAAGRGGIGIVRVSGPGVARIAAVVAGGLPEARKASLRDFVDAQGERIDQGLLIHFAAPNSYTGEAVLELHGHGGPVVLRTLLSAVLDAGARLAEPGEFTRRAYLNDRLDLAQAEAVADLIDASSLQAARSAMRSLSGEFSAAIEALAAELTALRALTEAMLDFPEEEVDQIHQGDALARLEGLRASLDRVLVRSRQGSLLREGLHVVLAGLPNVGKSSLLNRLAGEDRAIVTAVPGTTRDALRESLDLEGVPVVVVDTAGLRESADEVEREGMARTRRELVRADLVLMVVDLERRVPRDVPPEARAMLTVVNKIDLDPAVVPGGSGAEIRVSAKTGAGFDALRAAILQAAGWQPPAESTFLARERHLRALELARLHLAAARERVAQWELFAEELRAAQQALGAITGGLSADDLLGEIFSRFCIGK
jgi:tRNA modification GTPase